MISGRDIRLNRVVVRLAAALYAAIAAGATSVAAQPTPPTGDWGLPQLMRNLAQVKAASAQFTERKTVHMLSAPLVTSGMLNYIAPDRMQKITVSPKPERFILDGDQVTIAGGPDKQVHTFSLADYPQIGGLVEGIRATLAGDLAALDRFYVVQLSGDPSNWQLLLQPKDTDLTRFVKWIRIAGSRNRIVDVETEDTDGDHSDMSIVEDAGDAR